MAAFDTTRTAYGSTAVVSSISSFFSGLVAAVVSWNDARITRKVLSGLSDRELEDIGLVRGDIDDVAMPYLIR
ncbi:DUF1127 domain-containing protein [Sulfitobacter aestuariivivens]|uniref:DUF1127 domain-containing protein n=1 Tax=Sulfitobacter aestuariivivens TaxID=2766981 RepID=A0A927D2H1_9RHOB|nr:DUF1127 domain-containing protein [Sulfitobacter aestuariivivens]MBD3663873.1 DUF1127 domain-containing protein [Sulfitobacter aestuariivivens]